MSEFSNHDLELYVMGAYEGDVLAIEAFLANDEKAQAFVANEAKLELTLRQAAESATFCVACDDLVRENRCGHCGAAAQAGGYQVEKVLVENAHGRLYLASDSDGKRVALKELVFVQSPGAEALAAFEREAKFLRALSHPRIPRFVASFSEGNGVHTRLYLAQEFIDGESLDTRLAGHWFTEEEILDIGEQVLEVLVYLQSLSPIVVHRDIKPANLVRRADGTIAVVDFGAALDRGQTQGSTTIGTFGYMPLEQMAGVVDSTTDLYALGASLWHLLTRQEPWKMLGSSAMEAANVSGPVDAYLRKMVANSPADRFPSARAARAELAKVRRGELPVVATPKPLSRREQKKLAKAEKAQRPRKSWAWPIASTIIGVVAIGAGANIAITAIESGTRSDGMSYTQARRGDDRAEFGTLNLHGPSGVTVDIDGERLGVLPVRVRVRAGKRHLRLTYPDGKTVEKTVQIAPRGLIEFAFSKTPGDHTFTEFSAPEE